MKKKNRLFMFLKTALIVFVLSFGVGTYANGASEIDAVAVQDFQENATQIENNESADQQESLIDEKKVVANNGKTLVNEKKSGAIASDSSIEGNNNKTFSDSATHMGEKQAVKSSSENTNKQKASEQSNYTVEFTHNDLQYVLKGNESVKLSKILDKVKIVGKNVERVECSDERLFSASQESGEWIVTSHKLFDSKEWMKVTVDGKLYNITVTDSTSGSCGTNMTWSLVGNTLYVKGTASGATMNNATSAGTSIFSGLSKADVKCIILGDNVTNIGNYALCNFPNLEVVSIPDTISGSGKIGTQAFIYIPTTAHICYWGSGASSSALTTACGGSLSNAFPNIPSANFHYLSSSIGYASSDKVYYAFGSGNTTAYISGKGEMKNWDNSSNRSPFYSQRSALTTAVICGENVDIGQYAFTSCSNLTNVYIYGNTLNKVCGRAFYLCTGLQKITLPDSVTRINTNAFSECKNLKNLAWNDGGNIARLPDSISIIEDYGFYRCHALDTVLCPSTITSLGDRTFGRDDGQGDLKFYYWGESADALTLAQKCNGYGGMNLTPRMCNTFKNSNGNVLCEFYYQETEIGATSNWVYAVYTEDNAYCYVRKWPKGDNNTGIIKDLGLDVKPWQNVSTMAFSEGITEIGNHMCHSLTSGSQGTTVDGGCTNLTTLYLPKTLTKIGYRAFAHCYALGSVTIDSNVVFIDQGAFYTNLSYPMNIYYSNTESERSDPVAALAAKCDAGQIESSFPRVAGYSPYTFYYKCGEGLWYTFASTNALANISKGPESTGTAMWDYTYNGGTISPFQRVASTLTTVRISDATTIGAYAFYGCTNLTTFGPTTGQVIIPNTIKNIGKGVFEGCTGITTASFQATSTVTTIPESMFYSCTSLSSITLPSSVQSIGVNAFKNCSSLPSITLSNNTTEIGNSAFESSGLTSIDLKNVTTIGKYAFKNCESLPSIIISNKVTSIGEQGFGYCDVLATVEITPNSLLSIGKDAFKGLKSGAKIYYANNESAKANPEKDLSDKCYSDGTDTNGRIYNSFGYTVDSGVSGHYVFYFKCGNNAYYSIDNNKASITGSGDLWVYDAQDTSTAKTPLYDRRSEYTSVEFATGITSVGQRMFKACSNITALTLSDTITKINPSAFEAISITSLDLKSVETVDNYAFKNCTGLTSLEITSTVKKVGNECFYCDSANGYVSNLSEVIITPNGNLQIGQNAFKDLKSGAKIYYRNSNTVKANPEADLAAKCYNSTIPGSFSTDRNYEFYYRCGDHLWYTFSNSDATVTIVGDGYVPTETGTDTTQIAFAMWDYASQQTPFYAKASTLTTANISDATTIGEYAFCTCTALTDVTIPTTVTALNQDAFSNISGLTTVTFAQPSNLKTINRGVFYNTGLTSVTLPDKLEKIATYAFGLCSSLTEVLIPSKVTFIGRNAFQNTHENAKFYCSNAYSKTNLGTLCKDDGGAAQNNIAYSFNRHGTQHFYFQCGDNLWYELTGTNDSAATILAYPSDATDKTMWNWASGDATHPTPSPFTQMASTLTTVDFGPATTIGSYAFNNCSAITTITIPSTIANVMNGQTVATYGIGDHAFTGLASGAKIYYRNSNTVKANPEADLAAKCYNSTIPGSFSTDRNYEFYYRCGDHLWYTFSNSDATVTIVGDGYVPTETGTDTTQIAFAMWDYASRQTPFYAKASTLTTANISDATTIGKYAFNRCTALTGITIPASVTALNQDAFSDCTGITHVEIPTTVTGIGNYAFFNCASLSTVIINPNIGLAIGNSSFGRLCPNANIYYHNGFSFRFDPVADFESKCYDNTQSGNPYGKIYNSFGYEVDSTISGCYIFHFKCGDHLWYYTRYQSVSGLIKTTIVGDGYTPSEQGTDTTQNAFAMWNYGNADSTYSPFYRNSDPIELLDISDATTVGEYAFYQCSGLTDLTIPNSITVLGTGAFDQCSNLNSITIPISVISIGQYAFQNLACNQTTPSVVNVYYPGKKAVFESLCTTSVTSCFDFGVGISDMLLYHFRQDITYITEDGTTPYTGLTPNAYETNTGRINLATPPERATYRFVGWCTDVSLQSDAVYFFQADNNEFDDKVFYVKWVLNTCRILYDCRGGFIANPTVNEYEPGSGATLTLDKPTYQGHAFCGWHRNNDLSDDATLIFVVGSNTEDVSFYAEWYACVDVDYWDGQARVLSSDYEVVKSCEPVIGTAGQTTWYVLKDDAIDDLYFTMTVLGDVRLILKDGCTMHLENIAVDSPNSITIYPQHSDDYYQQPINLPEDLELLKLRVLQNDYCLINNKRYNLFDNWRDIFFYSDDFTEVYQRLNVGTASFNANYADLSVLAIPKANVGDDYTDDNGDVYTWNGTCFENSAGDEFRLYQEDSSVNGYSYWKGPIKADTTYDPETDLRGFKRFVFKDAANRLYYLDHDDAVAPCRYDTSGTEEASARDGDYVYLPTQPDKKYYYVNSSFNGSAHTFRYTDGEETETLTLYVATEYTSRYIDDDGNRYFGYYDSQLGERYIVNPEDISETKYVDVNMPNQGENIPIEIFVVDSNVDLSAYQDEDGNFTNGHTRGVIYSTYDYSNNSASIGSSAKDVSSGAITIYGGEIRYIGNIGSAGKTASSTDTVTTGDITIYGGKIYPNDGSRGSIGGGENMSGGNIEIHGGQVVASYIGAGEGVAPADDDTNLSISWTSKTDEIVLTGDRRISSFSVDADHKFVLVGELMADSGSVINSKSDLPLGLDEIEMYPYYPSDISYMLTIPSRTILPFRFTSGKFGSANADSFSISSYSETAGETGGASHPYSLAVIITKNHLIKDGSQGGSNQTLEYSLRDYDSDVGVVNKCFIMSNDNDYVNYSYGSVAKLGGSKNIRISVNDPSVWSSLEPGIYRSTVSFTVGLCTVPPLIKAFPEGGIT